MWTDLMDTRGLSVMLVVKPDQREDHGDDHQQNSVKAPILKKRYRLTAAVGPVGAVYECPDHDLCKRTEACDRDGGSHPRTAADEGRDLIRDKRTKLKGEYREAGDVVQKRFAFLIANDHHIPSHREKSKKRRDY